MMISPLDVFEFWRVSIAASHLICTVILDWSEQMMALGATDFTSPEFWSPAGSA
jgi:hypothetical protein